MMLKCFICAKETTLYSGLLPMCEDCISLPFATKMAVVRLRDSMDRAKISSQTNRPEESSPETGADNAGPIYLRDKSLDSES
jgi:hypothetical protein